MVPHNAQKRSAEARKKKKSTTNEGDVPHAVTTKNGLNRLNYEGWTGDMSFLATIHTGASVMIAKPKIAVGLPETPD
jgi:hypothetical protein